MKKKKNLLPALKIAVYRKLLFLNVEKVQI